MATKQPAKIQQPWANRIVGEGDEAPDQLLANPFNFRIHPKFQQDALGAVLNEVGWVQRVLVNRRSGHVIDGHLRVSLAISRGEPSVPVVYVDLDAADEAKILATLDPLAALAVTDQEQLTALLAEVTTDDEALLALLGGMAGAAPAAGESGPPVVRPTLADRFIVPPFSVLDARQGYWQDRKRQWISLGIQSELGRGQATRPGSPGDHRPGAAGEGQYSGGDAYRFGGSARPPNATPGGLQRDAASLGPDGKTVRGDGRWRPASSLARTFGQDLMRGEHTVGQNRLTWVPGDRPEGELDETSRKNLAAGRRPQGFPHGPTVTQNADGTLRYRGASRDQWLETSEGNEASGTSIFDPVLCELAYRWFCPLGGAILDPFAGGSVRGIVAAVLGRSYVGVDLRPEQVAANEVQARAIIPDGQTRWLVGDSLDVATLAPGAYDLVFSCPPYADLEVYSDDPRDISTMTYPDFLAAYRRIIAASVGLLKEDRFACFVVGDVRDPKGFYRNFVADTVAAFQDAGARLYNDAVLVTAVGSLPIRVGRQFEAGRKLGKTHQNVLVFVKGDPRKATAACGPVEVVDLAELFGDVAE